MAGRQRYPLYAGSEIPGHQRLRSPIQFRDSEIPCPHLHVYREGFGDKWASAAPVDRYTNTLDLFSTCEAFLQHSNITGASKMQKGLFS